MNHIALVSLALLCLNEILIKMWLVEMCVCVWWLLSIIVVLRNWVLACTLGFRDDIHWRDNEFSTHWTVFCVTDFVFHQDHYLSACRTWITKLLSACKSICFVFLDSEAIKGTLLRVYALQRLNKQQINNWTASLFN